MYEKCSAALAIREMVIKLVIRYLFTLSKIATIKKNGKQQVWVRIQRNRSPRAQLEGKENGASASANSLAVLRRIKHRAALWPSNSMPRCTPERSENIYPQKNLARNAQSSIINSSDEVKTTQIRTHSDQLRAGKHETFETGYYMAASCKHWWTTRSQTQKTIYPLFQASLIAQLVKNLPGRLWSMGY